MNKQQIKEDGIEIAKEWYKWLESHGLYNADTWVYSDFLKTINHSKADYVYILIKSKELLPKAQDESDLSRFFYFLAGLFSGGGMGCSTIRIDNFRPNNVNDFIKYRYANEKDYFFNTDNDVNEQLLEFVKELRNTTKNIKFNPKFDSKKINSNKFLENKSNFHILEKQELIEDIDNLTEETEKWINIAKIKETELIKNKEARNEMIEKLRNILDSILKYGRIQKGKINYLLIRDKIKQPIEELNRILLQNEKVMPEFIDKLKIMLKTIDNDRWDWMLIFTDIASKSVKSITNNEVIKKTVAEKLNNMQTTNDVLVTQNKEITETIKGIRNMLNLDKEIKNIESKLNNKKVKKALEDRNLNEMIKETKIEKNPIQEDEESEDIINEMLKTIESKPKRQKITE